jgi:PAS domain S-box-containing protein
LNLSSKLSFALITVVLIVVAGHVGYSAYIDYKSTRTMAAMAVANVGGSDKPGRLTASLTAAEEQTEQIASTLVKDSRMTAAIEAKDKGEIASIIRALIEKTFFPGSVQVVDGQGNVIFSTETPSSSGYNVKDDSFGIQAVLAGNDFFKGVTSSEKTGHLAISSVRPTAKGHNVIAVNQPLSSDFLTALATRFGIENTDLQGVQLVVYSDRYKKAVDYSQEITKYKGAMNFVLGLNGQNLKSAIAVPFMGLDLVQLQQLIIGQPGFEKNEAWWNYVPLKEKPNSAVGAIFICKPVPDETKTIVLALAMGGAVGIFGGIVGLFLATRISASVDEPLRFLVKRTQAIASNKQVIPPLEGLSGDWLELGELIDTAVLSMRSTTQSLKVQLDKQRQQTQEKQMLSEQSNQQMDTLNKQITTQAQKISELTRHIQQAGRQTITVQQQLEAVLGSSTEGFLILDQYGNILHANPVFLNWSGANEAEIAGRLCFDLVRKPGEPPQGSGQAFAQHGGDPMALINQFYPEGVVYNKNGEKKIDVLAHLQPLSGDEGAVIGYIMVLRDKTLRSENQLLRQEIVAMLRENIRGPLAGAEVSWHAILTNARNTMHPSVGQALAELHNHYEQLIAVIDSLLMMYGGFVPPPTTPRESINVSRLVADCLEEATPLARERQLLLDYKTVTGLPPINGNKEAIMGILRQVLERMIVITAAGGRVRVESLVRGPEMRIGVSSSGPALPQSEIAEMFVGFVEGKHTQDTYSSRLSMYLARNNVERLGGKIWAESEAGRGTTTFFTLPIN